MNQTTHTNRRTGRVVRSLVALGFVLVAAVTAGVAAAGTTGALECAASAKSAVYPFNSC